MLHKKHRLIIRFQNMSTLIGVRFMSLLCFYSLGLQLQISDMTTCQIAMTHFYGHNKRGQFYCIGAYAYTLSMAAKPNARRQ